ncbi:MAG: hypothetical protein K8H88_23715, partial [Sandaracinaceae bacterium]|nr:hypothetical protein [Sandaracinaceae bacterium]
MRPRRRILAVDVERERAPSHHRPQGILIVVALGLGSVLVPVGLAVGAVLYFTSAPREQTHLF